MDKIYLKELIRKYNRGEATPEEELFLKNYYDQFESEPDVFASMDEEKKAALKTDIYKVLSERISAGEPHHSKVRAISKRFVVRMAVAASLLVVCATAVFYFYHIPSKASVVSVHGRQKKENQLVYLPDGSKVIVSWGSKFYSSPSFGSGKREVYLEGQAYFDIYHDPTKPFIVHTGKLATTVLGTAFNVKAIPGEEEITVTVTRGRVKISDEKKTLGLITPGREIIYYKKADSSVQKQVNVNDRLNWKEQDLLVNNVTVEEAAKLLEERFGVSITVSDPETRNERFTTVFLKSESLEQILKSICEFNDAVFQYNKENATVIISKSNIPTNSN